MASFLQAIDLGLRATLFTKFGDILSLADVNTGVVYYPKDIALKKIAEKREASSRTKSRLEFINCWRKTTAPDWSRMRSSVARRGINIVNTASGTLTGTTIKAIPAKLEYDVWYWSRDKDKLNLITERYLFWQQNDPNIALTYNDVYPLNFDLHFGEIVDESTEIQMHDIGTYYVIKAPVILDGWIFTTPTTSNTIQSIWLEIFDKDDLTASQYDEIVDSDSSEYDSELHDSLVLVTKTITE